MTRLRAIVIDPGSAGAGCACTAWAPDEHGVPRVRAAWFERACYFRPGQAVPPVLAPSYGAGAKADVVVVERPVYQGARTMRSRPEDLMNLSWDGALLAGEFAGRDGCPIVAYPPSDVVDPRCKAHSTRRVRVAALGTPECTCQRGWKGPEAKPPHHRRLWRVLDESEQRVLGGKFVGDAIEAAVTKGALDRWGKSGVEYYPRSFKEHNLLDSAALGATHFGRLARRA